jgi:hypothetical protein
VTVAVSVDSSLQRDDWRGAVHELRDSKHRQAIVMSPVMGVIPLSAYWPKLRQFPARYVRVTEISFVDMDRDAQVPTVSPIKGFVRVEHRSAPTYELVRFRSIKPRSVDAFALALALPDSSMLLSAPHAKGQGWSTLDWLRAAP